MRELLQLYQNLKRENLQPIYTQLPTDEQLIGTQFNLTDYVISIGKNGKYKMFLIHTDFSTDPITKTKDLDFVRLRYFGEKEIPDPSAPNAFQKEIQRRASKLHRQKEQDHSRARNPQGFIRFISQKLDY